MVSCTTTTALNSQNTSNSRGTIATNIYNHFFVKYCVTLRKDSRGSWGSFYSETTEIETTNNQSKKFVNLKYGKEATLYYRTR